MGSKVVPPFTRPPRDGDLILSLAKYYARYEHGRGVPAISDIKRAAAEVAKLELKARRDKKPHTSVLMSLSRAAQQNAS